ncbi:7-carboxy-7-deazaguanine synthase QueE [Caldiplasma sukawensis]
MLLTEKFHSIQGEGIYTGIPMYFIRTNRCNLRCKWCDTTYSFQNGFEQDIESLKEEALSVWEKWICITGGEPLLQKETLILSNYLSSNGKNILLETGGSLPIEEYTSISELYIDMDIKTPSSGEEKRFYLNNLNFLRSGKDYVKFVVSDLRDIEYSQRFQERIPDGVEIIIQPAYGSDYQMLVQEFLKRKLRGRFMMQEHKFIWGDKSGV